MDLLIAPLSSAMLILGTFSIIRWARFRRSGEKIRLQFFLSDYLVSVLCIGVPPLTINFFDYLWYGEQAYLWLFTSATMIGLINGKAWQITRRCNRIPDSAYLAIGAGAGIATASAGFLIKRADAPIVIASISTVTVLGSITLIRWLHSCRKQHAPITFHLESPDIIFFAVCVELMIYAIHALRSYSDLGFASFVLGAVAGVVAGKLWALTTRRSPKQSGALYMGLGAMVGGLTTILSLVVQWLIALHFSNFNIAP